MPGSLSPEVLTPSRGCDGVRVQLGHRRRVLRLAQGSRTRHRRRRPAGYLRGDPDVGRVFSWRPSGPPDGAAAAPHPAGSHVARWTIAPPASLPAELPHRTTYPTHSLLTAARRRGWRVDAPSSAAKPVTSARGWTLSDGEGAGQGRPVPDCPITHKRQAAGCRRCCAIPCGPEGREKQTQPPSGSPQKQPAGRRRRCATSGFVGRAAGRGVDAKA